ncbi:hypothetical protein Tco_0219606, partial [Tanacetum coccineum]
MEKIQEVPNADSGTDSELLEQWKRVIVMSLLNHRICVIDIKEGLKVKAYEISVVKEKHDELVKQSLLTKSHTKVLSRIKQ